MNEVQTRIAEIERREKVAWPGPYRLTADEGFAVCGPYDDQERDAGRLDKVIANCDRHEDAVFFKYAREDIPFLLARVHQLEEALQSIVDFDAPSKNPDIRNAGVAAHAYRTAFRALTTAPHS